MVICRRIPTMRLLIHRQTATRPDATIQTETIMKNFKLAAQQITDIQAMVADHATLEMTLGNHRSQCFIDLTAMYHEAACTMDVFKAAIEVGLKVHFGKANDKTRKAKRVPAPQLIKDWSGRITQTVTAGIKPATSRRHDRGRSSPRTGHSQSDQGRWRDTRPAGKSRRRQKSHPCHDNQGRQDLDREGRPRHRAQAKRAQSRNGPAGVDPSTLEVAGWMGLHASTTSS